MKVLVIGGNRFFGKKLCHLILKDHHELTILNRGNEEDDLGDQVDRIICDRNNFSQMETLIGTQKWDIVL